MKTGVIRAGFSVIFEPVGKIVGFYQKYDTIIPMQSSRKLNGTIT